MPKDQGVDFPIDLHPDLTLLYNYKSIFDKPFGLTPDRSHNHRIPLLPGTNPMKIRPYRYPHKAQNEHMVAKMLNEGIISLAIAHSLHQHF